MKRHDNHLRAEVPLEDSGFAGCASNDCLNPFCDRSTHSFEELYTAPIIILRSTGVAQPLVGIMSFLRRPASEHAMHAASGDTGRASFPQIGAQGDIGRYLLVGALVGALSRARAALSP